MAQRMHPSGLAALVAVIVADLDFKDLPPVSEKDMDMLRKAILDRRRNRVEELARAYYAVNPCDFDNTNDWQENVPTNGMQNLAKLDRPNLYK